MILSNLGEDPDQLQMFVSSLVSSTYWDIGENHLDWTHVWPNTKLLLKQNEFIDVNTMLYQTSHHHIQAVVNNLKFINLDYLAAKKSEILVWCWDFCDWSTKRFFYFEGNTNALQMLYPVQYSKGNALHMHTQHWSSD